MGADPVLDDARHILDWITRTRADAFTRRDLFTALDRKRFAKVTDLDPALDLLEAHGHIRRAPEPDRVGRAGRPPSPTYHVHPCHYSALYPRSPGRQPPSTRRPGIGTQPPPCERSSPLMARKTTRNPAASSPAGTTEKLTVNEVCAELKISRSTFYAWRQSKKGPQTIRLPNGDLRVTRQALDAWLDDRQEVA
jgi:predicted DNA-binding transcriptional regulator AlpA